MKFEFLEYTMRKIFKYHTQNVLDKLFPDPYLKNKIEHISGLIV